MKTGDFYQHYDGGENYFDCIALPLDGKRNARKIQTARYYEGTHDIDLYIDDNGTTFIDSDVPHVLYQPERNYDTTFVFAMEVNKFFDTVTTVDDRVVKRFTLKR